MSVLRGDINKSEESKETVIAGRVILSEECESSPINWGVEFILSVKQSKIGRKEVQICDKIILGEAFESAN